MIIISISRKINLNLKLNSCYQGGLEV